MQVLVSFFSFSFWYFDTSHYVSSIQSVLRVIQCALDSPVFDRYIGLPSNMATFVHLSSMPLLPFNVYFLFIGDS